jgi:hypothetical protein
MVRYVVTCLFGFWHGDTIGDGAGPVVRDDGGWCNTEGTELRKGKGEMRRV